jgi:ketosteroid isomerase-like protein
MTGEHTGLDGINDLFEMIGEQLEVISFEMAPIAAEGDVVVAAGRQDYTVKTTGKKVQGPLVHVFTFGPDGKIVRFDEFETGAEGAFS